MIKDRSSKTSTRIALAAASLPILTGLIAAPANASVISTCEVAALCTLGVPTEGWDGPGLGAATIDYWVGNPFQANNGLPTGISLADFDAAISAAMGTWSSVAQLSWNRVGDAVTSGTSPFDASLNPQIVIYAAADDHGDGAPFDGAWNPSSGSGFVLAHAFAPPDIDGGSGNVHLDGDETWVTSGASIGSTSATIDLQTILLHELGHSLGLGHIDNNLLANREIVMQPGYFGELRTLSADDIAGIQSLYCPVGTDCNGQPPPVNQIPAPGSLFLLISGLIYLALGRRRLS